MVTKMPVQNSSQVEMSGRNIISSLPSSNFDLAKLRPWQAVPGILVIALSYAGGICAGMRLTAPNSMVSRLLSYILHVGVLKNIPDDRLILVPGLWYTIVTFCLSAGLAVVGQGISDVGYRNRAPRMAKAMLTGLPYRMNASHQNLLETFSAFAFTAAMALGLMNGSSLPVRGQVLRLVTLHAFLKTFFYVPFYLLNWDMARSIIHFVAIGALIGAQGLLIFG